MARFILPAFLYETDLCLGWELVGQGKVVPGTMWCQTRMVPTPGYDDTLDSSRRSRILTPQIIRLTRPLMDSDFWSLPELAWPLTVIQAPPSVVSSHTPVRYGAFLLTPEQRWTPTEPPLLEATEMSSFLDALLVPPWDIGYEFISAAVPATQVTHGAMVPTEAPVLLVRVRKKGLVRPRYEYFLVAPIPVPVASVPPSQNMQARSPVSPHNKSGRPKRSEQRSELLEFITTLKDVVRDYRTGHSGNDPTQEEISSNWPSPGMKTRRLYNWLKEALPLMGYPFVDFPSRPIQSALKAWLRDFPDGKDSRPRRPVRNPF